MLSEKPPLSVVLPVYNGQKYLSEAVESILCQTWKDFELLAIDDGSTDSSGEILSQFEARDPRVRVLRQENRGLVASLNRGCIEARGGYIARMDADDVSLPSRFEQQIAAMEGSIKTVVLGGSIWLTGADGRRVSIQTYPLTDSAIREQLGLGCQFAHPAVMFRKEAWEAAGGYRPEFIHGEDYDMWLRMAEQGELANLAEPILCYRMHANQRTVTETRTVVIYALWAAALAEIRRQGLQEPEQHTFPVTDATLEKLGVSREAIEQKLVATCILQAQFSQRAGFGGLAAQQLDTALGAIRVSPLQKSIKKQMLYNVHTQFSRLLMKDGKWGRAFIQAALSAGLRPGRIPGAVWLRVSGRRRRANATYDRSTSP